MEYSPILWASGAYTYTVSDAIFSCLSLFMLSSVRILCSLSASFISITLGSLVSVSRIFLKFSACFELFVSITFDILVRPSTIRAISVPNSLSISSSVISVSSTVSCSSAQMVLRIPSPISSTQIIATANGCSIYGSPLFLRILLCASTDISKASRIFSLPLFVSFGLSALNKVLY